MPETRHRVCNIEITEEQHFLLQRYLPYGQQKRIFQILVSDFLDMLKANPAEVLGGLLTRDLTLKDILKGANNETGGS